jgi:hypothetical protein
MDYTGRVELQWARELRLAQCAVITGSTNLRHFEKKIGKLRALGKLRVM